MFCLLETCRKNVTPIKLRIAKQQIAQQQQDGVTLKRKPGRPRKNPIEDPLKHKKISKANHQV